MNLHNVELLISAVNMNQYPKTDVCEVAFAGRSNVGKSSLINKLLNRKSLARVSQKPGKTATINFYNIDNTMNFVDLPGYGYAQVSKEEKKRWAKMIETYLSKRTQLSQVILLVDSRHKPTGDDVTMINFIRNYCERAVVIATKCDKISKKQLEDNLRTIIETLKLSGDDIIIPFSTVKNIGIEEFWCYVSEILGVEV
ncbi:MAG: YihA family ribosome biogenesis GTP-binding protein [Ruminococcaceae bacterium]|nr:YihA family ribosome biogenesis GTP-binding protein [Oscillospiraceae bacterium]